MPNSLILHPQHSAHAQFTVSPHIAKKMPPFLTGVLPKTVGITSSSKPASVSRRQNRSNAANGHALCTRVSAEDRLEAPGATRGQMQREICTHKLHSSRRQLSSDLGSCNPISLAFFGQCVYVYHKGHRQAELFVV